VNASLKVHPGQEDAADLVSRRSPSFEEPLAVAVDRTAAWLIEQQHTDGYWCGELEGDTILESEYILLLAWLGREQSDVARRAARYILRQQQPHGGWSLYPGGEIDISGSVKAYFALKLTGHDPAADSMRRARAAIRAAGGADRVNSFTRYYLALLGQISYDRCPVVPAEMILLPGWFPVNIYRISAWSRTILVPLSIMSAHRPVRDLPEEAGIRELFIRDESKWPPPRCPGKPPGGLFSWDHVFRQLDRAMHVHERYTSRPLRQWALKYAEQWMIDRFADSDGLGAIFPPIIWSVVALKCLGYAEESPEVESCLGELDALIIEDEETVRLQPCKSPVWDTTIALRALSAAGHRPGQSAVDRAVDWLLEKEVTRPGDWSQTVRAAPGGWFFEHRNAFYPDLDDTAMALIAFGELFDEEPAVLAGTFDSSKSARQFALRADRVRAAARRAKAWTLAMQNRDGGWGAFDKDNDAEFLCHVPFADHNAMIDPSTPDLAARVVEGLAAWGMRAEDEPMERAIRYLRETQEPDGAWFGRWGVNYIYGTWQCLVGLRAAGIPSDDEAIQAGARFLLAHQQACGGWGETADSYADPSLRGQGEVTPSQTAWAMLGLMAAGRGDHPAVRDAAARLVELQNDDGTWDEEPFTGTGFPLVFYLKYHLYRVYFPLLALAQYRNLLKP